MSRAARPASVKIDAANLQWALNMLRAEMVNRVPSECALTEECHALYLAQVDTVLNELSYVMADFPFGKPLELRLRRDAGAGQ